MEEVEIDLREYLFIIRKKLWLVITLPVLFVIIAGLVTSLVLTEEYEADSTVYIISNRNVDHLGVDSTVINSDVMADLRLGDMLINDYREMVKQRRVLDEVIKSLGYEGKISRGQLSGMISADLRRDTRIMQIKVRNQDPKLAAILADRTSEVLAEVVSEIMLFENIRILDTAVVPNNPISPNLKLNLAISFVLGLMLALGIVFLLEYLDNTLKTSDDVEKYLNLPVLAVISMVDEKKEKKRGHTHGKNK